MKHMMIKVLSLLMALTMIMGVLGTMGISAAEHVHTKGETIKVVKPTCTSAGYSVYKCTTCEEAYEDDLVPADKENHSLKAYYVNGNERGKGAATCTEPAATEGLACARRGCGKIITKSEYVKGSEPLGHDYTLEIELPTCENAGMIYRSCARCVAEELANAEDDVLNELPESAKDGKVVLGVVSNIPAENGEHVYVYEITKAPTCKAWGTAKYFCKLCDEVSFESIAVRNTGVPHITKKVEKVAETCTTDGKKEHYACTVCAATFSDAAATTAASADSLKIAKKNHANSSFLNASSDYAVKNGIDAADINTTGATTVADALNYMSTMASCTKNAQFYALCADCGEVWTKSFTAAHSYKNYEAANKVEDKVYTFAEVPTDGKWYKTSNANCVAGKAYVAKCAKGCGNYQEKATTEGKTGTEGKHIWGTKNSTGFVPVATDATCTTGAFETWYCMVSGCGSSQIVYTASSLGHDFYYTCDTDAKCTDCTHANRVKKCTRCTETWNVTTAEKHNYKTVDVVASCQVIAHKEDVCQNEGCKAVVVDNTSYTGTVDPNNHAGQKVAKDSIPATCYAEGTNYWSCDCGVKTWTTAIAKLACNGTYTVLPAVAATCNTTGKTEGLSCSVHGVVVAQIDTPYNKANHNTTGATLKTQVAGTCYIEGYRIYTCGNAACAAETGLAPEFTIVDGKNAANHVNKDNVPAFKEGKALTAATHTKVGYHGYKICAYCNVNIELDKAANTAACAVCKIAADNQLPSPHRTYAEGEAYTGGILSVVEIPATGHVLTIVAATPATHTTAGYTASLVCVDCPDNKGDDLVVHGGDVIVPHGDKYMVELKEANCFTSGLACTGFDYVDANGKATKVCAYCERANLRYVPASHSVVTVETTITVGNESVTVHACSLCDKPVSSVANDKFVALSDTWYLNNYVDLNHTHNYDVNKEDKKDYDETKEVTSNEYYGKSEPACQVAVYKVAKCQVAGCSHWEIIETVTPAPGHYVGAKKTPMAIGCKTYVAGTSCAACGADADDVTHNWGSGDDYGVVKVPTCTEDGIALRACIDCGVKENLNPNTIAKYAAYNWTWDGAAWIAPALGHSPISLDSYSFSKDSFNVVTYSATCTVCAEKYTEEVNILKDRVELAVSAKDANGSEWTANGNTIVVTVAYTAADYKFRDLTANYYFNTDALTFQKAEVVAEFEGASTDVVVVDGKATIYTFVSAPGKMTNMSGNDVAYVDLYFTVDKTGNNVLANNFAYGGAIAHVYNDADELVLDSPFVVGETKDINAYVTGDLNNDGAFTPADLLAVMDIIYGEEAKYDAIADVDKDGDVDVDDFAALKTFVLSKKTAKDYIIMVSGEYVDIMPTLLAIAKEESLDADGNGVVTRSDVSDILTVASELYWYVHAGEVNWTYGAALNATMVQDADFTDALVDAYNAYMGK